MTTLFNKNQSRLRVCIVMSFFLAGLFGASHAAEAKKKKRKRTKIEKKEKALPAPTPPAEIKPWAVGVSAADQSKAFLLFEEGNNTFGKRSYADALKSYKEAIKSWDHPAIRFNMAECYIYLEQPVLAFENLEKALAYDGKALDASIYERALTNQKLLDGQLAYLIVQNKQADAKVTLDGEILLDKQVKIAKVIKPGKHQIVAMKPGYLTRTDDLVLMPGETTKIELQLVKLGDIPMVRRWSAWKPWAVVGGGVALAAAGAGLQYRARTNNQGFDDYVQDNCPLGCPQGDLPNDISGKRDSAKWQNAASLGVMGAGAAVLTVGVGLVIMNQPKRQDPKEANAARNSVSFTPSVSPNSAGFVVGGHF